MKEMNLFGAGNKKDVEYLTELADLEMVKKDGMRLEFVKNPTPEIRLAAVKQNGCALQYVKDQTPEICLAAIKQNPEAKRFVRIALD